MLHRLYISWSFVTLLTLLACQNDESMPADNATSTSTLSTPSSESTDNSSSTNSSTSSSSTDTDSDAPTAYVLASVVLTDVGRNTYVQTLPTLPTGHITNDRAIEVAGNAVVLTHGRDVFVGLTEEPTWKRYSINAAGELQESGAVSFANLGLAAIEYGNVIVDGTLAVSVSESQAVAVVWDPQTMMIRGSIDLGHLVRDGYSLEAWTTVAHNGVVYIPGRWANWDAAKVLQEVSLTMIDPQNLKVLGVAQDDRCASGGRPVFDSEGYAYVMGDGRNYASHMFAAASGGQAVDNCILRIAPGTTDFETDFYQSIPSLSGGRQSVTELETARQGSGLGLTKMFYPERLPPDVKATDFDFWGLPVFKTWRITLGNPSTAVEVADAPFSTLGFGGSTINGILYSGESPDYATSTIYAIDPVNNRATLRFTMDGLFYGLSALTP